MKRLGDLKWKTNYCGIFFALLEGGEAISEIQGSLLLQRKISGISHVSFFKISRSGYYDYVKRRDKLQKDNILAEMVAECQRRCGKTYGYRRVHIWLMREKSLHCNPKTVLRVMNKFGLLWEIRRRKKYKYMGQQLHKYENLINQNFTADKPNVKWVTDISYIHTGQGVLYLSMIRDLYDNSIVAYKLDAEQTANLVINTIKAAMREEKVAKELQLHSDQGF